MNRGFKGNTDEGEGGGHVYPPRHDFSLTRAPRVTTPPCRLSSTRPAAPAELSEGVNR